jgi:ATP phosphoribosyltransferase regulatory subunit
MNRQDRWILPAGIEELLPPEAQALEALRRKLLDLYWCWGYDLVIPPLIEYLESLLTGTGQDLDLQTFKLTDQLNGRMMGARADITPQAARIDAHRLGGEGVRRLCYIGTVLHTRPDDFGGSRCPLQVGAELFGHNGLASDFEVLQLMLETLAVAGMADLHLELGHVGIYHALAMQAALSAADEAELFDILQRKAGHELVQFLATQGLTPALSGMFSALIDLNGGPEILIEAKQALAAGGEEVMVAMAQLQNLIALIARKYPALPIHLDLAELRGYAYHTGVIFAAFQAGQGRDLARGGRYDHVGEVFGKARPATGFSADLKMLLSSAVESPVNAAGICAPISEDAELERLVKLLRSRGERVIQALSDVELPAGCDRRITQGQAGWQVVPIG